MFKLASIFERVPDNRTSLNGDAGHKSDSQQLQHPAIEFGDNFVGAMRQKSALNPEVLYPLDVVDVFADSGQFQFRGVVESRDVGCAVVRIDHSAAASLAGTAQEVRIENCRHADAQSPPVTLQQWEVARDVQSSYPPR